MAKASAAKLSTYEWISLHDSQIHARGHDPIRRLCYTGHGSFIRQQWLPSLGKWGGLETAEMVSEAAPHQALLHVSSSAYRQFKARHGLMTGRQFARHHGPHPWTRAEICFLEEARAQRVLGDANGMRYVPIGTACHFAVATARVRIGILAIELVVWSSIFGQMLNHHGISIEDWDAFTDADKLFVWELGQDGVPWDFDEAARGPAPLHVEDQRLEAAE